MCSAGDAANEVYVVAAGSIGVRKANGKAILGTAAPGAVIGEYGLVTRDARRTATLYGIHRTEVLSLDYPRFRQFVLAMLGVTVERRQEARARTIR